MKKNIHQKRAFIFACLYLLYVLGITTAIGVKVVQMGLMDNIKICLLVAMNINGVLPLLFILTDRNHE